MGLAGDVTALDDGVMSDFTKTLDLPTAEQTDQLGVELASLARQGDCILLRGQIGAGKSALARAFIRARLGPTTEVPSPTFTLVQTYEDPAGADIWHADLYRLSDPQEAVELGLTEAFETAICLIEWPELISDLAPESALHIDLSVEAKTHTATLRYGTAWQDRLSDLTIHA